MKTKELSKQDLSMETSLYEKRVQWADSFCSGNICDRASFYSAIKLIQSIKATKDYPGMDKVPIVIVGNKRDLNHRRTVLSEEGRLLALTTDCQFYELSAAENYHSVLMMFYGRIERIWETLSAIKKPAGFMGIVKRMSADFSPRFAVKALYTRDGQLRINFQK